MLSVLLYCCVWIVVTVIKTAVLGSHPSFPFEKLYGYEEYKVIKPKISTEHIFEEDILFVQIDKWLLTFRNDANLQFVSNFKAEWIEANTVTKGNFLKCDYKTGIIQGLEGLSHTAVSICGISLTGYFEIRDSFYFFEPLNGTSSDHLLFKIKKKRNSPIRTARSAHLNPDWLFNMTGDTIDIHGNESDADIEFNHHPYPLPDVGNGQDPDKWGNADAEIPLEYLWKGSSREYVVENGYFYDTAWSAVITEAGDASGQQKCPTNHVKHLPRKLFIVAQTFNISLQFVVDEFLKFKFFDSLHFVERLQFNFFDRCKSSTKISVYANRGPSSETIPVKCGSQSIAFVEYLAQNMSTSKDMWAGHSSSRNILPTRWLEIAVGVDHTLISFHGKDKVEQYVLALMNIVSAIYQDPSLGASIKLVITKLQFYEHHKHGVVRPGNAKKSLENVNVWNRKLHASLKPDEPKHDVAIWLTRSDIGGPSGYAPVGGVCDPKRSCALNKDEGLSSAFIIAHEMAHLLGLSHDGDKKAGNTCDQDANEGSIMASMVSATFSKFLWSPCSKKEYEEKVGNWTCLTNTPRTKDEILLNATLQTAFSMDEQCRMEFGDGYMLCRAFDIIEPCQHLWCGHKDNPLVCKTKKGPPLEGTECGFGKLCVSSYCTDLPQDADKIPIYLNPQNGGWSNWSSWGPCSRTCGTGVHYRYRQCDNPKPTYGGEYCDGPTEDFQLCNKGQCKNPFVDLRAQQCLLMPVILNITGTADVWLPFESQEDDKKCKFSCVNPETKEIFILDENLPDGIPCTYDNEDKICIQGKCYGIGCNGELNSTLHRDECGVCGGDGSNCTNSNIMVNKKLKKEMSKLTVLPKMARHIKIETNATSENVTDVPIIAFVLKNREKRGYTVTIPNAAVNSKIVEGTNFFYKKLRRKHIMWGTGPVLAEIVIMVITSANQLLKGIELSTNTQYSIHKDFLTPSERYVWITGGWGPCSVSCGGGKKQKTAGCWDNKHNKLVKRKYCSLLQKPPVETERCNNFGCQFEFVAGEWEPCSMSCGKLGVQYREIYCIPNSMVRSLTNVSNALQEIWMHMVNPRKCVGVAPVAIRACHRVPCLYVWQYSEWSPCSASCGNGITTRTAYCPALEDGICNEPPGPQKKICVGNYTRVNNKLCKGRKLKQCKDDESKYCGFHLLKRYCKLKGFRILCCKSCAGQVKRHLKHLQEDSE